MQSHVGNFSIQKTMWLQCPAMSTSLSRNRVLQAKPRTSFDKVDVGPRHCGVQDKRSPIIITTCPQYFAAEDHFGAFCMAWRCLIPELLQPSENKAILGPSICKLELPAAPAAHSRPTFVGAPVSSSVTKVAMRYCFFRHQQSALLH